jgi:GxxExxY protein
MPEPPRELDVLANKVIGAAIEVHRHLGPGFLESVYEEALAAELGIRNVVFERQKLVRIVYKTHGVGEHRLDFFVKNGLVVELKSVDGFSPLHKAQLISYLRAVRSPLGLLINFNEKWLKNGIQRVVLT